MDRQKELSKDILMRKPGRTNWLVMAGMRTNKGKGTNPGFTVQTTWGMGDGKQETEGEAADIKESQLIQQWLND